MNPVLANPDIKINMSLDEIIHFTKEEINSQLQRRHLRGFRKKKRNSNNKTFSVDANHSVPVLETTDGVGIYVSNQSPSLNAEDKRKITQAISNRELNSNLLEKSKEIIPAEYKLVKTTYGLERVLVPAVNRVNPLQKKLPRPRKLKTNFEKPKHTINNSLSDKPPPLVAAPIFKTNKMEVDNADDDIIIIDNPGSNNQLDVIDITSDVSDDIWQAKKLCVSAAVGLPHKTTLNDRFTMLCGSFQF